MPLFCLMRGAVVTVGFASFLPSAVAYILTGRALRNATDKFLRGGIEKISAILTIIIPLVDTKCKEFVVAFHFPKEKYTPRPQTPLYTTVLCNCTAFLWTTIHSWTVYRSNQLQSSRDVCGCLCSGEKCSANGNRTCLSILPPFELQQQHFRRLA